MSFDAAYGRLQNLADAAPALPPCIGLVPGRVGSGFCMPLGTGGVAIGFAFRDILRNALAGVLILLTRPSRIGDRVVAGGYEGAVEDIQVRATTIRTGHNRRAVIPDLGLFTGKVPVNTAHDKRRLRVRVGVGHGGAPAPRRRVPRDGAGDGHGAAAHGEAAGGAPPNRRGAVGPPR